MGRILVIRGGAIGDFVLTLPAIRLLRDAFPDTDIEILGYRGIASLAEGRYYARRIRSIDYADMAGFFIPHGELSSDLSAYFESFDQVVSYIFDPDGMFEANLRRAGVRNLVVVSPKLDDSAHAAVQLARPLEKLALFLEDPVAVLYPHAGDLAAARELVGAETFAGGFVALHPGSGGQAKNWPVDRWIALGQWIAVRRTPGVPVVLVGGEADEATLPAVAEGLGRAVARVVRDAPLPHVAALLSRCALFVGHDSGISHIAAAAGAPCVLLFGPTDPGIWAPQGKNVRVIVSPDESMGGLAIEAVREAVSVAWPA